MSQLPEFWVKTTKIEDVTIHFHSTSITQFNESLVSDAVTAYTNVWESLSIFYNGNGTELVGDVCIAARNQGKEISYCLLFSSNLSAFSDRDNDPQSVFCKALQQIFELMKEYIVTNNITDITGKQVTYPAFHYSKERVRLRNR